MLRLKDVYDSQKEIHIIREKCAMCENPESILSIKIVDVIQNNKVLAYIDLNKKDRIFLINGLLQLE